MSEIEKLKMDGVVTQDDILRKVNEVIDEYNAIKKFEMELNAVWLLINNFCSQDTVKKIKDQIQITMKKMEKEFV